MLLHSYEYSISYRLQFKSLDFINQVIEELEPPNVEYSIPVFINYLYRIRSSSSSGGKSQAPGSVGKGCQQIRGVCRL